MGKAWRETLFMAFDDLELSKTFNFFIVKGVDLFASF